MKFAMLGGKDIYGATTGAEMFYGSSRTGTNAAITLSTGFSCANTGAWMFISNTAPTRSVTADSSGNIYTIAYVGPTQWAVAKYTSAGSRVWETSLTMSGSMSDIALTTSHVIVVGGQISGSFRTIVFKFQQSDGTLVAQAANTSSSISYAQGVGIDGSDNIFLLESNQTPVCHVTKLDVNLAFQWHASHQHASLSTYCYGMTFDPAFGVFFAGTYDQQGTTLQIPYIGRMGTTGGASWPLTKTLDVSGAAGESAIGIAYSNYSSCIIVITSSGRLYKLDINGNVVWERLLQRDSATGLQYITVAQNCLCVDQTTGDIYISAPTSTANFLACVTDSAVVKWGVSLPIAGYSNGGNKIVLKNNLLYIAVSNGVLVIDPLKPPSGFAGTFCASPLFLKLTSPTVGTTPTNQIPSATGTAAQTFGSPGLSWTTAVTTTGATSVAASDSATGAMVLHRTRGAGSTTQLHSTLLDPLSFMAVNSNSALANTPNIAGFGPPTYPLNLQSGGNPSSAVMDLVFRKTTGAFSMVRYNGTGATQSIAHGLGAKPELLIVKNINNAGDWVVAYWNSGGSTYYINNPTVFALNSSNTQTVTTYTALADATSFDPNMMTGSATKTPVNAASNEYFGMFFATKAGVSKVGIYTGNGGAAGTDGTGQSIACGFSTTARFILIKRLDATGNWNVFDYARGINTGAADPYMALNTTNSADNSNNAVEPYAAGFTVTQTLSLDLNATSSTYLFLAIS